MNNLEKFTAGEVAARNNGTLEQLMEVVGHCFPKGKNKPKGLFKFYYKKRGFDLRWDCWDSTTLPTIDITQLWEELQALKKPEIWFIRVTEENKETLEKWYGYGNLIPNYHLIGMVKRLGKITKSCNSKGISKGDSYDFGNEIDFPTFLKYTGVEETEPEKVEKSLEEKPLHEKLNELSELVDLRNKAIARHKVIFTEIEQIETKISALLK